MGAWRWRDDGVADDEIIEALTECVEHLPEGTLAAQVLGSLQMEYLTARRPAEADVCGRASGARWPVPPGIRPYCCGS